MKTGHIKLMLLSIATLAISLYFGTIFVETKVNRGSATAYQTQAVSRALFGDGMKQGACNRFVQPLLLRLMSAGYLENHNPSKRGDYYIYDRVMVDAVKHFQKDISIKEDGIVTPEMFDLLYVWNPLCTSYPLGSRKLDTSEKTAGSDVDDLVWLLKQAGVTPQEDLYEYTDRGELTSDVILYMSAIKGGIGYDQYVSRHRHHVYTEDIRTAVRVFQALNGLKPTGDLDNVTIQKLKSFIR